MVWVGWLVMVTHDITGDGGRSRDVDEVPVRSQEVTLMVWVTMISTGGEGTFSGSFCWSFGGRGGLDGLGS